jgi:hypothetical protein
MGNTSAYSVVTAATTELIAKADSIVLLCTGSNCNVSNSTTEKIKQQLSILSQSQASNTLKILTIPISSVVGNNIFNGFLDLGAAVSSTYSYQCGASITSNLCVYNGNAVVIARNNLIQLIEDPINKSINNIINLSIIFGIVVILLFLFLIFLVVGTIEFIAEGILRRNKTVKTVKTIPEEKNIPQVKPDEIPQVKTILQPEVNNETNSEILPIKIN